MARLVSPTALWVQQVSHLPSRRKRLIAREKRNDRLIAGFEAERCEARMVQAIPAHEMNYKKH